MGGILTGPVAFVRALGLLASRPGLVKFGLLPALVALVVSIAALGVAVTRSDDLFALLVSEPESGWLRVLWQAGFVATMFVSIVAVLVLTPWAVMLVGFPLCDPLVERLDAALGGPTQSPGGLVAGMIASLRSSLAILAIGLSGTLFFFVVGLLPGVGLLTAPFVALVWTPLFLAFDLLDSPLSRRGLGFRQKVAFLRRHLVAALSLGLVATPLVALPLLNLIGLPLAVAAGVVALRGLERGGVTTPKRA